MRHLHEARVRAIAGILLALILAHATPAAADQFPVIEAADLNGRRVTLPNDLPGSPSLVLVVFNRAQQPVADAWIAALDLRRRNDIDWIELPVLRAILKPGSPFVDAGMRAGMPDRDGRARIITTYGQRGFIEAAGLPSFTTPYTMVVDRSGRIRLALPGAPSRQSPSFAHSANHGNNRKGNASEAAARA